MDTSALESDKKVDDELNMEKKKSNPPINPRDPMTGKYTSRQSLTKERQVKWSESVAKGEKNPNLGHLGMKPVDIDNAAQRLVERIRLSATLASTGGSVSSLELQTPPTKTKMTQGLNPGSKIRLTKETSVDPLYVTDSAFNRVNANNIFVNLGDDSSSDEEKGKVIGSTLDVI